MGVIVRRPRQGAGQDKEKSNDDESSRRTDWQIYGTWHPLPKLEIYRTDSYKSEMARRRLRAAVRARARKLLSRKNIFTPRDGAEPERNEHARTKKEVLDARQRCRSLRSRRRKVDGRGEFAEARFMDYRLSV